MPRKVKLLYLSPLALQFDEFFHNLLIVKTTPQKLNYCIYPFWHCNLTNFFTFAKFTPCLGMV